MPNTLPIDKLRARSLDVDRLELTWEVSDTQQDALDYTFVVLRSESPEGPYEQLTPPFTDRYIFVDARLPQGDKFRQLHYKLRVVHKASGDTVDHGPAAQEPEPDLVANFIRRSQMTFLTQAIGRMVWLFKIRTFGARCTMCFDSVTNQRTAAACLDCFNTGFMRGFHNPIEVWMQIDPSQSAVQNAPQQIAHHVMTRGRTSFYPNISPKDVVVELENKRWRVTDVVGSERLRATVKQELTLYQIQSTDIEYRLPINLTEALRDVQPSPGRMFTNPTDMNAHIEELTPDVFANYPTYPRNASEE